MLTEGFPALENCWASAATSIPQGIVAPPCLHGHVWFYQGNMTSSCILVAGYRKLCSPSRNCQLRQTCPRLKKSGRLQPRLRLAEPSRRSWSSRSVQLQQKQALSSWCKYSPPWSSLLLEGRWDSTSSTDLLRGIKTAPSSTTLSCHVKIFLLLKCIIYHYESNASRENGSWAFLN